MSGAPLPQPHKDQLRAYYMKNRLHRRGVPFLEAWRAAEAIVRAAPDPLAERARRLRS